MTDIPELTVHDFERALTRSRRRRLIAGQFETGDLVFITRHG